MGPDEFGIQIGGEQTVLGGRNVFSKIGFSFVGLIGGQLGERQTDGAISFNLQGTKTVSNLKKG